MAEGGDAFDLADCSHIRRHATAFTDDAPDEVGQCVTWGFTVTAHEYNQCVTRVLWANMRRCRLRDEHDDEGCNTWAFLTGLEEPLRVRVCSLPIAPFA